MGLKDLIRPKRMGSSVDQNSTQSPKQPEQSTKEHPNSSRQVSLFVVVRESGISPRQASTSTSRRPAKSPFTRSGVFLCVPPDLVSSSSLLRSVFLHQDIPFLSKFPARRATRADYDKALPSTSRTIRRTKINYFPRSHFGTKIVVPASKNDQLRFDDEFPQEPFWLSLIADVIWGVKSLFTFLVEQPSQLKYIEWPSFSNTVRTATLTLVLVALFIVALASVDSALCYMLALVLRKAS